MTELERQSYRDYVRARSDLPADADRFAEYLAALADLLHAFGAFGRRVRDIYREGER